MNKLKYVLIGLLVSFNAYAGLFGDPPVTGGAGLTKFAESEPTQGIPFGKLTPSNAGTNVGIILQPKGSGAFSVTTPDGTATGGNTRGIYAIDWGRTRTTAAQVASNDYTTISGGRENTASGTYATVVGGYNNTASGSDAVSGGRSTTASGDYSVAIGSNSVASALYAISVGGNSGSASGVGSAIIGGNGHAVSGTQSFVGGGAGGHIVAGAQAAIVGGDDHSINSGAARSFIGGGYQSTIGSNSTDTAIISSYNANISSSVLNGTIIGGYNSSLSHSNSNNIGTYTRSIRIGSLNYSSGAFGSSGDSQGSLNVHRRETTDATPVYMSSSWGASATIIADNTLNLQNNTAVYFVGTVVATTAAGAVASSWEVKGLVRKAGTNASVAFVGTPTVTVLFQDAGASTWAFLPEVDTTLGSVKFKVTGAAATTIRWVFNFQTTEALKS